MLGSSSRFSPRAQVVVGLVAPLLLISAASSAGVANAPEPPQGCDPASSSASAGACSADVAPSTVAWSLLQKKSTNSRTGGSVEIREAAKAELLQDLQSQYDRTFHSEKAVKPKVDDDPPNADADEQKEEKGKSDQHGKSSKHPNRHAAGKKSEKKRHEKEAKVEKEKEEEAETDAEAKKEAANDDEQERIAQAKKQREINEKEDSLDKPRDAEAEEEQQDEQKTDGETEAPVTTAPVASTEICTYSPAPECVSIFQFKGVNYTGCTTSIRWPIVFWWTTWCSHDAVYSGSWSKCSRECETINGTDNGTTAEPASNDTVDPANGDDQTSEDKSDITSGTEEAEENDAAPSENDDVAQELDATGENDADTAENDDAQESVDESPEESADESPVAAESDDDEFIDESAAAAKATTEAEAALKIEAQGLKIEDEPTPAPKKTKHENAQKKKQRAIHKKKPHAAKSE